MIVVCVYRSRHLADYRQTMIQASRFAHTKWHFIQRFSPYCDCTVDLHDLDLYVHAVLTTPRWLSRLSRTRRHIGANTFAHLEGGYRSLSLSIYVSLTLILSPLLSLILCLSPSLRPSVPPSLHLSVSPSLSPSL